jgi:30S ribosomal protein S31
MGKGDKRTRRGKIFVGSYGKSRPKPHTAAFVATEKPAVEKAPKKR